MKLSSKIIHCLIISVALILPQSIQAKKTTNSIKRYSLIVGANNGGHRRDLLKYAVKDAVSFGSVLHKIGGVEKSNRIILKDPEKGEIINKFNNIFRRIKKDKRKGLRTEFIFYYSGHSDEESVFLGNEKMYYSDISRRIKKMPSDVKIAILDSCSSGAFTRTKGGKMRAPFLVDSAFNMKGYAFLSSSSADEVSQESDRIKGSFFTHYLNTGLLGAADMSGDKRITLNEAYQYAYTSTLSRTEKTRGGPQHPNYNIQMSGTGDVVMTDITASPAILILGKDISGRVFIHDDKEQLIAEIIKPEGKIIQLGLEKGNYSLVNLSKGLTRTKNITIVNNKKAFVASNDFTFMQQEIAFARGDKKKNYRRITIHPALMPDSSGKETIVNVSISILGDYCSVLDGVSFTPGVMIVDEELKGAQFAGIGNITAGESKWIQAASCFNVSRSSFFGAQIAGVFNYTGGNFNGCQAGAAFNINTNSFEGLQMAGVFNHTGENLSGAQLAACFNNTKENSSGAQLAGVFNYTGKNFKGTQIAACFNNTSGKFSGFQGSAVFNRTAESFYGGQFSCVNIAGDVEGAQIGLVNISDNAKGLQLGLVNISDDMDGIPIGLVNIIKNGETYGEFWYDNAGFIKASLSHGNKKFYSLYSLGAEETGDLFSIGIGLGSHFDITESFFINFDISANSINKIKGSAFKETNSLHSQARLYTGFNINSGFTIIGGISYNYLTSFGESEAPVFNPDLYRASGSHDHRHWLGFFVGFRI